MDKNIIVLAGPTSSGKSNLAFLIAKKFNSQIISADSSAIYKLLDIGTAKPSLSQREQVVHHMIDIVKPDREFSVYDYISMATPILDNILESGKSAVIVGGTGLYIKALLYQNSIGKYTYDQNIRQELQNMLQQKGKEYLYNMLKELDIDTANKLNSNDTRRVMRAIEIYKITGSKKSVLIRQDGQPKYDFDFFVINKNRQDLYNTINLRVDEMISNGLIDEVYRLLKYRDCQSMRSIGYKELVDYFDGKHTEQEAIELVKKNTRNYAKRQLTYFRQFKDCVWCNCQELMDKYEL